MAVPVKESKGRRWCVTVGSGVLQLIGWSEKTSLKSDVYSYVKFKNKIKLKKKKKEKKKIKVTCRQIPQ